MPDYQRSPERFVFTGIQAVPADVVSPGKAPFARNVRSYEDGTIRPRPGFTAKLTVADGIHSLMRLNDPTTFNGGVPAVRVVGAGGDVYRGDPTDASPAVLDTGYSGDPLVFVTAQPPQSPRPWLYVADADRYRKFKTDGDPYDVGLAQPSAPDTVPGVSLQSLQQSSQDIQTSAAWVAAGVVATVPSTTGQRVNSTISQILYDAGTTGYCSIVPADPANITVGTLLTVGNPLGSFDNAIVTEVTIPIADTTVESIIYDSGVTGLCTIQPVGSLGTGQLDAPPIQSYRQRAFREQGQNYAVPRGTAGNLPPAPNPDAPTLRIRQVDFPVNCILELGGEIVRILSVAVGPDGRQSFRCRTSITIAAGATIVGLPAFRLSLPSTYAPGAGLLRLFLENTLTYTAPPTGEKARLTGGIQAPFVINLSQFASGDAVLPDDELHVAVNVDRLAEVVSVRVYIDVDPTTNDFLQNYYFHEWRASDIVKAVQSVNAQTVTPLVDARKTVVANRQLEMTPEVRVTKGGPMYRDPLTGKWRPGTPPREANPNAIGRNPTSMSAIATQLGLGNSQWIDLRVKIGTLIHVGADPTRTLADAAAFEILLSCEGLEEDSTPEPLTVKYSDLQIYGGGGPDVGEVGDPYVYTYRYRSSMTGAVSNPAPAERGGVIPRRQNVVVTPTPSADPQVDKIDWFRLGGALSQYTYLGTGPNTSDPFTDDREDQAIDGGEVIAYDNFQPWPLLDLPHTGVCKVAGTAVQWVSGDTFDTRWAPGSIIVVNGRATSLYASPTSSTLLHIVDSVGANETAEFMLPGPTILSQPLPRVWGDYQGLFFACGDATNPGTLYWTNGNNIEALNDANALLVTSGSEQLMNGGVANTFAFVFSSENLYTILVQPGAQIPVRVIKTPCGRGLWTPWAWCIAPEGIYFLAKDGLFLTAFGAPAEPVHIPDLQTIFPKDGVEGESTNGILAPDMSQQTRLRLSYIAGMLYFDYVSL